MAQHVRSHLHLHPHSHPASTFFLTSTTPSTQSTSLSPCCFTFPFLSSPSSISISRSRSSPSSIPLRHEEGRLQDDVPVSSLHLQPIGSEDHFDRVVAEAQHQQHVLLIVWMASWCRKCIYLKPKLEKLAVDYYPRLQFYSVDVNAVSHKLVAHAGVTKMPTIQLWKDSKKQAEVVGGNKAYLVINEVREMIENECTV
ncbi:thioredoxin-like 3-2, chloroplastic [Vicia villosa]|uniref:thioredoxin-like 3-2, chloroplastic n=1 Tax=Vicia villosa TaxID=3911 RepID=UPI00273AF0DE|nr:thioredoxin-like 3-2, chloroplastic [Vicia villosa]